MGAAELGRYRLKRVLGRGAMGEVWEAHDTELGRRVAVKIMHTADDELALARTRFGREARIAAVLRHPNIVVVHDAGELAGTCFMVMELVEGKPLRSLIGAPTVTLEEKLLWIRQIGDALTAMHEAGIVHRDVKPDNVIVRADGSACLVDFGIAKWTKSEEAPTREEGAVETADDVIVGTPDYLPPETRYTGVFDEKSDQYAWAVMAYELLAGVHPADVNGRPLSDRADIPVSVIETIEKASKRLPTERFESIDAALDELASAPKSVKPSKAPRPRPAPRPAPESSSVPFVIGLLAVIAVGAIAFGLFLLMRDRKPPDTTSPTPSFAPSASVEPILPVAPEPPPSTNPPPHSGARIHPSPAPVSGVANVTFSSWVTRATADDFQRRNAPHWAACFANTPPACKAKTIRITCDVLRGGALVHCSAGWTHAPAVPPCQNVRDCVLTKMAAGLLVQQGDPTTVDILVTVP